MPTFHYRATTPEGKRRKGTIEAESQARAFFLLREQGLLPLRIEPAGKAQTVRSLRDRLSSLFVPRQFRLGESFYYLSLLLQSGTTLVEALDLLGRMSGKKAGKLWLEVREKVEEGQSFSKTLAEYPQHVPAIYVGMVKVAEEVGKLGEVLEKIAGYEARQTEVRGHLTTAMVYPSVIALVGIGAVYFLLTRVLPNIAKIFDKSYASLPSSTKLLLGFSALLSDLGPLVLVPPLLGALAAVAAYRQQTAFRAAVDRVLWRLPLLQKIQLARFSGMLGFQLESGIPMVRALENARQAVSNAHFRAIIDHARNEVSSGKALDRVLGATKEFPDLYILTLSTGARTGKLGAFTLRLANIFEMEVDGALKKALALIEPVLILVIGLGVGFVVLAIMGPIFDLTTLVR